MKKEMIVLLFLVSSISGCSTGTSENIPEPTKTVYVPAPESGINSGFQDELDSNLENIRKSNCRLADDLMIQSLDLSRQARDLESQAVAMESGSDISNQLKEQARKINQQSINLWIQSDQLRRNC